MEDVNITRQISLFPSKLWCGPQEFNPWEIHLHLRFYASWNNGDKVFTNVVVVIAKAPYINLHYSHLQICERV